ncbi:TIM barrel protein [Candidatus Woesearchaeota archaeon]|nr:TIM barrel protein [Candidatus Woesearchaeota archaeon]
MKKIDRLRFGTAGIPVSSKGDTIQGIEDVRKLNLDSMELEFVHSINVKENKTGLVKEVAKKKDIILTAHGSYYINLNSDDKKKIEASKRRIIDAARILSLCNGHSICYHAGFYGNQHPEKVYLKIKEEIKNLVKHVREFDKDLWISPEVSGKVSQFGSVDELIKLSNDIEQVMPCIDFSHNFSRSIGKANKLEDFREILNKIKDNLGKEYLERMHIHVAGIEYGEKGEKNHLLLSESKFNYKDLMKALKEFKVKGVLICESPNIEGDALLMKDYYEKV